MSAERRRTPTLTAAAFLTLTLVAMGVVGACDRGGDDSSGESRAVTPDERGHDETKQKAKPGSGGEEEGEEEHGHEHGEHGGVHIADAMYELGRRFSAIWFAGQVGNKAMVDYQVHEIEELHAELAKASPTENGVDVAGRLKSDVLEPLEGLSETVGQSDLGDFEKTYTNIMKNCESCHTATGHDFINLKKPEYNPYPNLDMTPEE